MDDRTARRVTDRPLSGETRSSVQDARDRAPRSLLSSSMVGTANCGLVLQALFDLGPTSRAELARHAGVNRTTISGIVQPLIDGNVLVETGPSRSTRGGGKPGRPLRFSPNARPICGVLLMPGAVRVVPSDPRRRDNRREPSCAAERGWPCSSDNQAVKKSIRLAIAGAAKAPLGVGVAVGAHGRYEPRFNRRYEPRFIARRLSPGGRASTTNSACQCVSIITLARSSSAIDGLARAAEQHNSL